MAKVMEQLPVPMPNVPVQLSPVPAVTVKPPVGVPDPVTVALILTGWPTAEGFALVEFITVMVGDCNTEIGTEALLIA